MSYVDPATSQMPQSVVKVATQFVLDFRLAEVTWRRNQDGAAPDQAEMVDCWNAIKDIELSTISVASLQAQVNASAKKLSRFRSRMNLLYGPVKYSKKDIPLEEARMKAISRCIQNSKIKNKTNSLQRLSAVPGKKLFQPHF